MERHRWRGRQMIPWCSAFNLRTCAGGFSQPVTLALLLAPRCCGSWFLLLFRFCRRPGRFGRNAVSSPKLGAPYGADKRASGWLFCLGLSRGRSMFCSRRVLRKAGTDQCKNETYCRGHLFHLRFASSPISMLGQPPKAGEPCQKAEAVTKEQARCA